MKIHQSLPLALVIFGSFAIAEELQDSLERDYDTAFISDSTREARLALLRIRIPATNCSTTLVSDFTEGYCDGIVSCLSYLGAVVGICPSKIGICCIVKKRCGQELFTRVGYFVNQGFPQPTTSTGSCQITINRYQSDVTQVRLDFVQFNLDAPNVDGVCLTEGLVVVSGSDPTFDIPQICGIETGQHMYINFADDSDQLVLSVMLNGGSSSTFNIRITQFRDSSPDKAPEGCLQYFTEASGSVTSFNFAGTQHLASQMYDVCIEKARTDCIVTWTANTFDIASPDTLTDQCAASFDFISIASGQFNATTFLNTICGTFPAMISTDDSRLQVNFNANEEIEIGTQGRKGFDLSYVVDTCV